MDPITSQLRQETVVPTAVVTKKDSERWAKVLAHLQKVGHQDINIAHMTLLEEVHYTRNPAGGKVHGPISIYATLHARQPHEPLQVACRHCC
jgi:hypothetical protein